MNTKTAATISVERYEKIRGIAYGDVSGAFNSLQLLFTQRKQIADALWRDALKDGRGWAALELTEIEIKKALSL